MSDQSRENSADGGPAKPDQPGGIAPPPGTGPAGETAPPTGSGPTSRPTGTPPSGPGRPDGAANSGQGGLDADGPPGSSGSSPGLRLGSPFGIPIFLAPSSLVLALLLAYVFGPAAAREIPGLGGAAFLVGLAFAAMLYGSVLLHELSHSVVARSFGIPVRRIVLQLLGGVSELEREPETAGRELLVAIAGPGLSLVLAAAGLGLGQLLPEESLIRWLVLGIGGANLLVGLFNLLPGLPLDGGRVLRAVA
ncbi:MAG TPA: site-2 protease family protein [Actinomycetes bacterium]|nr:site-2 protease family protein [Actinomycetes bacterium]